VLTGQNPTARYYLTLMHVELVVRGLQGMVTSAFHAPPQQRAEALEQLHNQARAVATMLNHALGGWPHPGENPDPGWVPAVALAPRIPAQRPHPSTHAPLPAPVTATQLPPGAAAAARHEGNGSPAASDWPAVATASMTAYRFAKAWARPNLNHARWLAGVTAFTPVPYARALAGLPPETNPARAVIGTPTIVSSKTAIVFEVPLDVGTLRVTCTARHGVWKVTNVIRLGHDR
jgi:hypothetical protein